MDVGALYGGGLAAAVDGFAGVFVFAWGFTGGGAGFLAPVFVLCGLGGAGTGFFAGAFVEGTGFDMVI